MKLCLRWILAVAAVVPLAALAQPGFDQHPPQSQPTQPAAQAQSPVNAASAAPQSGGYKSMSLQGNKLPQQDSDYAQPSLPAARRNAMPTNHQQTPADHAQDGQSPSTNTR